MPKYLFSIEQPDGPPPGNIGQIMHDVGEVEDAMREAGIWLFSGGLTPADSATVSAAR